jgi:hypothetical protein
MNLGVSPTLWVDAALVQTFINRQVWTLGDLNVGVQNVVIAVTALASGRLDLGV